MPPIYCWPLTHDVAKRKRQFLEFINSWNVPIDFSYVHVYDWLRRFCVFECIVSTREFYA